VEVTTSPTSKDTPNGGHINSLLNRLSTVEWIKNNTLDSMTRQYTLLTKVFYQAITKSQGFWNTLPGYLQAVV
jgi:hypothetical protein